MKNVTEWLLNRLVKGYQDSKEPIARNAVGRLASWAGIFVNLLLVVGKVIVGVLSGSVAVMADGLNNLMDAAGSIITLVGFKFAAKKADQEHPFGHGRFEYISGLAVAALVLVVGLEIGKNGVSEILNPSQVGFSLLFFVVLGASVFLKVWMALFYFHLGQRIGSTALKAVAVDSRNDALATGAVLLSAVVSRYTGAILDGWAGLGVALFIIYNGIGLIRETLNPLLGEAPSPELVEYITTKVTSYENVLGVHDVIIHDYGPDRHFVSIDVEMPGDEDPLVTHEIIDRIERDFLENDGVHLIIHYDPIVTEGKGKTLR